jgi:hypothetical protein
VIHIDTIYETEAFRFLARGMKDRHAVSVVHAVMLYGENTMREFERWASEHLEEIDNEIAEQTKQYKIGDLTADLVFRRHDIKNVSDLQLVFDTFEKELIELTARLANEQHAHKQTRADWSRQQEHRYWRLSYGHKAWRRAAVVVRSGNASKRRNGRYGEAAPRDAEQ